MCQIAVTTTFSPNFPIHVCDEEVYLESGSLKTPDLIKMLGQKHPDLEFR